MINDGWLTWLHESEEFAPEKTVNANRLCVGVTVGVGVLVGVGVFVDVEVGVGSQVLYFIHNSQSIYVVLWFQNSLGVIVLVDKIFQQLPLLSTTAVPGKK